MPAAAVPRIYTPANVSRMLSSGVGPVSYRLYTELSVQDWHWNPAGSFSSGTQGYWASTATPGAHTLDTYGYRLPRRGNTHDQGNDDDFSRLTDGDAATYWKSNPYLAPAYTHDTDAAHPQWVLVDFGKAVRVDTARIAWGTPYATQYRVQYWTGADPYYSADQGQWVDFPNAVVSSGAGGTQTLALGDPGRVVQFVRVWMTASSATCPPASADPRDCMGYAIGEIGLGTMVAGVFHDAVVHRADTNQTVTYASSTDPWHRGADRLTDQEQPGLDVVLDSGITRGLPLTVPVPMLYSTPANAAGEIAYLKARGANIARIELGEEPDGQFITPEDYASLYLQFADAVHAVDPALELGGPVYEGTLGDVAAWPDAHGETLWTKRFVAVLAARGRMGDLRFFSFEHYPFDQCGHAAAQANLLQSGDLIASTVAAFRKLLPPGLPIYVTEANYSANGNDNAQTQTGALWLADFYGSLLSAGAQGAFFYEYEPIPLSPAPPCPGYGTYGLLLGDAKYRAGKPLSQYWAMRMLTGVWAQAGGGAHNLYRARLPAGTPWVGAYPLHRPDGQWSVLLVNRDLSAAHIVSLRFGAGRVLVGPVAQTTFGAYQYAWVQAGANSRPDPDLPPARATVPGGAGASFTLPKASLTVLTGTIQ